MNPFKEIWFNTGKCVDHFLTKENQRFYIEVLPLIEGFALGLVEFLETDDPFRYFFLITRLAVTFLFLRFVFPWLLMVTGKLINAQGRIKEFRIILGLSSIPYVLDIFYVTLALVIPGDHAYRYALFDWIIWICVWRVIIIGIAKIKRISYEFALMNVVIPSLLIIILYLVLHLIFNFPLKT